MQLKYKFIIVHFHEHVLKKTKLSYTEVDYRRLKQKCHDFKASLNHIMNLRPA
jgi:hypothetical protein